MRFVEQHNGDHAYTTSQGDMVDQIAFKFYGHHDGTYELVLNANPGLALKGPVLGEGLRIILPPEPDRKVSRLVPLWD